MYGFLMRSGSFPFVFTFTEIREEVTWNFAMAVAQSCMGPSWDEKDELK
jgi:hypothetical protein